MLKAFEKFSLSKSQLKSIVGGTKAIECSLTVTYPDGSQFQTGGACSGSTVSACNSYMQNNCNNFPGRETCSFSCWESGGGNPE